MRFRLTILVILCSIGAHADVWSRVVTIKTMGLVESIAEERKGGVLLVGAVTGGPCVTRVVGLTADTHCFGAAMQNNGGHIAPAADGNGYFIFGSSYLPNTRTESSFVFRVDATGQLKWARRYALAADHFRIRAAAATTDGGLIAVGSLGEIESRNILYALSSFVMKIDSAGHVRWERTIDVSGHESFTDVKVVSDGAIVAGATPFGGLLYKFSNTGVTQWRKVLLAEVDAVSLLRNGDIVACGSTLEGTRIVDWLSRFDNRGNVKWQRASDTETNGFQRLSVDSEDRISAFRSVEATSKQPNEGLGIFRFDSDGGVLSQAVLTFPDMGSVFGIAEAADGGAILNVPLGGDRFALHKIDSNLRVPACVTRNAIQEAFHTQPKAEMQPPPIEERQDDVTEVAEVTQPKAVASTAVVGCAQQKTAAAPTPPPETEPAPSQASVELMTFDNDIERLAKAKDFVALDRIGEELRHSRAVFSNGTFKADELYELLSTEKGGVGLDQRTAFVDEWLHKEPSSATAIIAAANVYWTVAWRARGTGTSGTVTDTSWQKFTENMSHARQIVEAGAAAATGDPEYDKIRVLVAGGSSCDDLLALAFDKEIASRAYFPTAANIANYMLPRWCGSPGEHRRFAEFASAAMPEDRRDEVYGRIALQALEVEERAPIGQKTKFFSEYGYDWTRMKRGLLSFANRHPQDLVFWHRVAWAAWKADDRVAVRDLFARPELAWSADARRVWNGTAFYESARDWALKSEPFANVTKNPTKSPGWPPIILQNTVRLKDGGAVPGFNSFVVETSTGPVAVTALNRFDGQRAVFGRMQPAPILVSELRDKVAAWTMSSPSNTSAKLKVVSIEPRTAAEYSGSQERGVVLRFQPSAKLPVQSLKPRTTPLSPIARPGNWDRATVIGCKPGSSPCEERAFTIEVHGRQTMTTSGVGKFGLEFNDDVDWHDFIGSPVIDADGNVAGVVADDYPSPTGSGGPRNRASAEEIALVLERANQK